MRFITASVSGLVVLFGATGIVVAADPTNGETVGDIVSDVIFGNEPNLIPFEAGNKGPAEVEPRSIGDADGNAGRENNVEPSGAPGPVVCNGSWFGVAQFIGVGAEPTVVGDEDVPGMNVSCADSEPRPHTP